MSERFKLPAAFCGVLRYKDCDGDLISVSTDEEVEEALRLCGDGNTLKMTRTAAQGLAHVGADTAEKKGEEGVGKASAGALLNTHLQQTGLALGPHVQVQAFTAANTFDPALVIPSAPSMVSDQPTVVTEVVGDGDLSHTSSASDDSGIQTPENISLQKKNLEVAKENTTFYSTCVSSRFLTLLALSHSRSVTPLYLARDLALCHGSIMMG